MREIAEANGRDPTTIKFFAAINPIIGRTVEEAVAKFEEAKRHVDQFCCYTSIDLSTHPLDEELKLDASKPKESAALGFLVNFTDSIKDGDVWTPRKLGERIVIPTPVGTPAMVADIMEQWIDEADVDGFNMAYISNPLSFEDIIELLIPELRQRGLVFDDYAVPWGTFRENLLRQPGQKTLRSDHYGSTFKFEGNFPHVNGTGNEQSQEN